MNKNGPILIIEDDEDDRLILSDIFSHLKYPNEVIFFPNGKSALIFLFNTDKIPLLILSDIKMPMVDGFEVRDKFRKGASPKLKYIPYIFMSTTLNENQITKCYKESAQGLFKKPNSSNELEQTIRTIMNYWLACVAPYNSEDSERK